MNSEEVQVVFFSIGQTLSIFIIYAETLLFLTIRLLEKR
jgi:hypothetical protein